METISLEEKLKASIDLVAERRAKELTQAAHTAAVAIATGASAPFIQLGSVLSVDIVRAFARQHGRSTRLQLYQGFNVVEMIESASVSICGVTVQVQCSRPMESDDVARLAEQNKQGPRAA